MEIRFENLLDWAKYHWIQAMDLLTIPIQVNSDQTITSLWSVPKDFTPGQTDAVILAHGAGNDMNHPFMVTYQQGLAQAGLLSITFNFPYKELGRKAPDRPALLLQTWNAVVQALKAHPSLHPRRLFLGGKSMGGRMASLAVAEGLPCDGLVFLGYPLHPPKQPEKARTDHWPQIGCPSLFIEGTRDSLCDLDLLHQNLSKLKGPSTLMTVEGGDHSFKTPKSLRTDPDTIHLEVIEKIRQWINDHPCE